MDWERILWNSTPFLAMVCLIVLIVITTCARKLEEYENNVSSQPMLFDYVDNPKIQSLDSVETPTRYEQQRFSKHDIESAVQSVVGLGTRNRQVVDSRLTPDENTIEDENGYENESSQVSYEYPSYDPYNEEDHSTP